MIEVVLPLTGDVQNLVGGGLMYGLIGGLIESRGSGPNRLIIHETVMISNAER